ncbi:hypothetical protein TSA1_15530 [Bradyrhizobium nitroreducens]|uniref:Uncharacterized protein n=1 Tax=Bradyrhizobium nitroreducens TaxID=709803 RepID=A0A2M6UBS5_9BRAD|nr:hypothetical protein [Bradyrhizobium nitroreducens]PIT02019.1 hypothetical protein TSA1_15530 [Bradyrhizobium nitroreducens]
MRWKISPHLHLKPGPIPGPRRHHDPRTMDLIAIVALLTLVLGSGWYLASSLAMPPSTTAFVEPSQSVHW